MTSSNPAPLRKTTCGCGQPADGHRAPRLPLPDAEKRVSGPFHVAFVYLPGFSKDIAINETCDALFVPDDRVGSRSPLRTMAAHSLARSREAGVHVLPTGLS